jgi:hypothetical protein
MKDGFGADKDKMFYYTQQKLVYRLHKAAMARFELKTKNDDQKQT